MEQRVIVVNMVGRNEADRYLREVLEHVVQIPQVKKVVFTDDCSDDDTLSIAKEYATCYRTEEPLFTQHEGELRQTAWQAVEQNAEAGDWILGLDCDEKLYGWERLPELLATPNEVIGIAFYNMWNRTQYRTDKAWAPDYHTRLFRYYRGGQYKNMQLACGSIPTYVDAFQAQGKVLWHSGLRMQHLGYMRDEDKQMKYDRYMQLDGGRFHALWHLQSIIDSEPTLVDWED